MNELLTTIVMNVCGCKECEKGRPCDRVLLAVRRIKDMKIPTSPSRHCPVCKSMLEETSVYCDNCGTDTPRK